MAKTGMILKNKRREGTVKHRHRCNLCGRPRGFLRFFSVCRICFRKLATNGHLPGVRKSSW